MIRHKIMQENISHYLRCEMKRLKRDGILSLYIVKLATVITRKFSIICKDVSIACWE